MQAWNNVGPPEVLVGFGSPRPQRRVTVAFRLILFVPHFFVAFFIGLATYVMVIIGWFCALALGRLPYGIQQFLTGAVRYFLRLGAYGYLLTDVYPPFSTTPAPYPADVFVTPGRLNRLAVLFRFILIIPVAIVSIVVGSGTYVVLFFAWLITLVSGSLPPSLHQALAACLRYQTRFYTYFGLVTDAYPRGLFGDDPTRIPSAGVGFDQSAWGATTGIADPAVPPAPGQTYPPPFTPAPASYPPQYSSPYPPIPPPPYPPAPPLYPPAPPPFAVATPHIREGEPLAVRLVLNKPAKRLVVLIIVIGVITQVGSSIAQASLANLGTTSDLSSDYSQLTDAVVTYQTQMGTCRSENSFSCVQAAADELSTAFYIFSDQLLVLNVPSSAKADANRLFSGARSVASDAGRMGSASSPTDYQAAAESFQVDASSFDSDYRALVTDLG